jgi:DNA-binding GntR family transcriptional regulator
MSKKDLANKAYRAIKDGIIRYRLKPGSSLRFGDLSKALQMSQTPIREALSRLQQEHFVQPDSVKGYVVSTFDLQEVEELYDLRIILEVPTVRMAVRQMIETDRGELYDILQKVRSLITTGHKMETIELDKQFHATILKKSGNRLLSEIGENILDRVIRIQNLNVLTSDRLFVAHQHHEEIFNAIQEGDAEKAATLMERHLTSAKEYIMSRLRNDNDIMSKLLTGLPEKDWPATSLT